MKDHKNIRLTFDAWNELRKIKFEKRLSTYTAVFEIIFKKIDENPGSEDNLNITPETSQQEGEQAINHKTIVLTEFMHRRIASLKEKYMLQYGATSRGPGSVAISNVVLTLIQKYHELPDQPATSSKRSKDKSQD